MGRDMSVKAINRKSGYSVDFAGDIYDTIIDILPDAILLLDQNDGIIDVNKRTCKMTGYSREELLDMDFGSLILEETQKDMVCTFRGHEKETRLLKEFDLVKKDGDIVHAELSCSAFGNYFFCIIRDITKRKNAEESLKRTNKLKDLFIDIITHDLMNPVGIVLNYAELIEDEDLDEDVRVAVKAIINSTERVIRIISNASNLAKLERTERLELENLDMVILIKRVVEECRRLAEEKGIEIVTNLDETLPLWASYSIRDVFLNVISNAIKYSPDNTKIQISAEDLKDRVKIAVKDNGEGIPDEYKESIFERYKRKEKEGVKGSGLGLTIAKLIVELHKGRIWVEDNPEGGSIFYVEIPK